MKLQVHIAQHGIPSEIISYLIRAQGSPPLSSRAWSTSGELFPQSLPGHHQSNRKADAAVKSVKHMMYECMQDGTNVYSAVLASQSPTPTPGKTLASLLHS